MFRQIKPSAAIAKGRVKIEKGDHKALERLVRIVAFHSRLSSAT